ncbi:hypothetical protein, partial [Nocardia alni]|uniref:hypothetical protein n=1 Tax=Nocardia alni TaxID=2815723 RepID=UPI001C21F5F0
MRAKGMTYDTGFIRNRRTSRPDFDPGVVRRELEIIRDDLHCNAVQIVGGDPDRLETAARCAADLGLEVWFSPYPLELPAEEINSLFAECAERAERLRRAGAEVVFVAGVEMSLMNPGFIDGDTVQERLHRLFARTEGRAELLAEASTRVSEFLGAAAALIRARFGGRITYACIPFEQIDWTPFDIVSVELIRSAEVADRFRDGVRTLVAQGKPLAITGFGTAAWRGSGDIAPRSMEIVELDPRTEEPIRLNGTYLRDETEQASYLAELLEIFDSEGVDSTFVFLFALHTHP